MLNKKILILGVGNAQCDAIEYLKNKGYEVHGLSYKAEGAALLLVDKFDVINIIDKEAVLNYCITNKIDCIYSVGSDIAMPTVGYVAEKLGLVFFVDEDKAMLLNNKVALRTFLNKSGLSPIEFFKAKKTSDLSSWIKYPAIIKPVDSQGQRGVYPVNSQTDIELYFPESVKHSVSGEVILEEFVRGNEISVNAFIYKGEIKYLFISDRLVVEDYPGGIVRTHEIPTKLPAHLNSKVNELVQKCIQAVGIQDGPVYFQMKYTENDVKIIEMTPRLDGCHLWRLIKLCYDVDLLDLTFSILLGLNIEFKEPIPFTKSHKIEFFLQEPGTVFKQEAFTDKIQNSLFSQLYYNETEIVKPINGHFEKVGYFIS